MHRNDNFCPKMGDIQSNNVFVIMSTRWLSMVESFTPTIWKWRYASCTFNLFWTPIGLVNDSMHVLSPTHTHTQVFTITHTGVYNALADF